jgi:hypothetical protein
VIFPGGGPVRLSETHVVRWLIVWSELASDAIDRWTTSLRRTPVCMKSNSIHGEALSSLRPHESCISREGEPVLRSTLAAETPTGQAVRL